MIDPNAALCAWLLQSSAIAALAGDRIFSPLLPQNYDVGASGSAITLFTRGGSADAETPLVRPSVQIECWAPIGEFVQARALYGAVFDWIHGKNNIDCGDAGFILSCVEEVQGQDSTDPDTGWATVVAMFRLILRPASDNFAPQPQYGGLPAWQGYIPIGAIDGVNSEFVLPFAPTRTVLLFWNKVPQFRPDDFIISGSMMILGSPPAVGDTLVVFM